ITLCRSPTYPSQISTSLPTANSGESDQETCSMSSSQLLSSRVNMLRACRSSWTVTERRSAWAAAGNCVPLTRTLREGRSARGMAAPVLRRTGSITRAHGGTSGLQLGNGQHRPRLQVARVDDAVGGRDGPPQSRIAVLVRGQALQRVVAPHLARLGDIG